MRQELKMARLLEQMGKTAEAEQIRAALEPQKVSIESLIKEKENDDASREAEAVAAYFTGRGQGFKQLECSVCGGIFVVNRGSVSMCSDGCRARHLAKLGITWDATKSPDERWGVGQEPLVIGVIATKVVLEVQAHRLTEVLTETHRPTQNQPSTDTEVDVESLLQGLDLTL